ncbi:MAG: response regulator [Candidatus Tectomicrobia bacterium]|uniref:histidine kinase n=1 Tax=Tectimicrobiota bacterium TaxID=2528274 RepID=A0A932G0V1_UNCTE|nr:response regulator [Candidatus Tectomicrobia bacterium]
MDLERFADKIRSANARVEVLKQHLSAYPWPPPATQVEAFEELSTTLEELHVAQEELRTQNEQLESAYREIVVERQRYEDLFEFAPDGYLVTSMEGVIQQANRAAATLLNVSPQSLEGKPLVLFVVQEEIRGFRSQLNGLYHEGPDEKEWEVRLQPRNGTPLDAALKVATVRQQGKPVALRWLIRDITGHKRAEEEIRKMNAELEHRMCERTAQLETANQMKDRFLSMLAHELRNPLSAILSAVEILKLTNASESGSYQALEILDRQVRHQASLLDDLLDLTRINCGKVSLHRKLVDLVDLTHKSAKDCQESIARAGLAFTLELPEGPIWVLGNSTRLSQVLGNLLQNAVKFTDPGGQITLRVEATPDANQATVTVRDTGIGIVPEMLPYLFDTFAQADRSLDRRRGGLGLGLALVKQLVELHGGKAFASSEGLGHGSEFTLLLPLLCPQTELRQEASPPPESAPPTRHSQAESASPQHNPRRPEDPDILTVKPLRVLLIEDNRGVSDLLRLLLERSGHTVEVAYDGAAGVEAARRFRPEVVLCDLGLPKMDGYAVATTLRRDPVTATARLIALSGYGREEDRQRSREAGFDLHLVKPVGTEELQQALGSKLSSSQP